MSTALQQRAFQSWGRVSRSTYAIATPSFRDELPDLLRAGPGQPALAVGLGRSYGDSCLNSDGRLIDMTRLNRIIAFDCGQGIVHAEAGLSLDDLLRIIVPKGWFLPTTPGTRFVTLGGAVANDVHGKNHHAAGSLACSVRRLQLIRSDGSQSKLAADAAGPLFEATVGGLGLTGVIATVELKLAPIRSTYLDVERVAFGHVRDFFAVNAESTDKFEHTVAWVDCASGSRHLGRGFLQRARWRDDGDLTPHRARAPLAVPVEAPGFLFNRLSLKAFNALYYNAKTRGGERARVHYGSFFYPLDAIGQWNRLYGPRGFYQYQCVVPPEAAQAAVEEMLRQIVEAGTGSCLAVLKTLGPIRSPGMLSFPREGTTLALDFPNKGPATLKLLARLDVVVREARGRLYPAKDGRMPADMFRDGYPQWQEFARHIDPQFGSDFWRRVAA
jgi:L-gulonolactone oxidase